MQARGIRSINTMSSDAISLAPLNLDADSMAPEGWPYRRRCCPLDQRPTTRINGDGLGLSNEPPFATDAQE